MALGSPAAEAPGCAMILRWRSLRGRHLHQTPAVIVHWITSSSGRTRHGGAQPTRLRPAAQAEVKPPRETRTPLPEGTHLPGLLTSLCHRMTASSFPLITRGIRQPQADPREFWVRARGARRGARYGNARCGRHGPREWMCSSPSRDGGLRGAGGVRRLQALPMRRTHIRCSPARLQTGRV